ncbi:acetyl-CoA synthetase-like protein [Hypoxylon cercidicola]|nr:acetyl-CoA synthetase-like protein [Hypoxylon cercidicola]
MATPSLNYFVCTLGQAAHLKGEDGGVQNAFSTVLTLIEEQARYLPDRPALGFADLISKDRSQWPPDQVTFLELSNMSKHAAVVVADILHHPVATSESPTVGLLCTSSLDFILTWLGLMRIGCKAFLLAPQLDPRAIQHLCEVSGIRTILVDGLQRHKDLQLPDSIDIVEIPCFRSNYKADHNGYDESAREDCDVAYLRHTSGTSSGLPKQIVQTQWGATGCLPCFPNTGQTTSTFSTTPLYHGGLADCFRAWTSGAMVWIFPEGAMPITGNNIVRSITYARNRSSAPVKYFSSVPYVLQLLADEHEGFRILQSMELVGVGGAALAPSIGDKLVELGVNLVSRMGSSECGFLMSSHRDYAKDREWQYLRPIVDPRFLSFEPRGDGLSELVVKPSWPLISKSNRDDGSYATADLFEPHLSIPDAWRYHSRADAQITLANGKKFDPSPLEEAIKTSTRLVRDVLVFGAGEDYPGALLFKTSNNILDLEVVNATWPLINKLNSETPSHSRLARSMLVVIDSKGDEEPLAKSSKGTILRHQAEARYADFILQAYAGKATPSRKTQKIADADLYSVLLKFFNQVLGHDIDAHQDFFQQGVDSIACIQVRKLINSSVLIDGFPKLPLNIIYDSGNLNMLIENIIRIRRGGDSSSPCNDTSLMSKLITKYSTFPRFVPGDRRPDCEVVLLTGATGSLGAHVLSQVVAMPNVTMVYCLVRASTTEEARSRVISSLKSRRVFHPAVAAKAVCLPSDFSQESLGLDPLAFETLRSTVTTVIHSAWMVNFHVSLSSFERSHIAGVHNMMKLCLSVPFQAPAKFFFISSISAAAGTPVPATIREVYVEDLHHAPNTGYARSKLVTEHIIRAAARSTGIYAKVLRTGQLIGDVENGLWNPTEAIPLMIQSAITIGALPMLDETSSWLPVDKCASAVLELSGLTRSANEELSKSCEEVYHVLNPTTFSWSNDMLPALKVAGLKFETVSPREWVKQLSEGEQDLQKNPTVKLLDFYAEKYCSNADGRNGLVFETSTTAEHSETIRRGFDIIQSRILQKCLDNWRSDWTKQQ